LARFFGLGMLISILPGCLTDPSDRSLLFSGLGAMGLMALFLSDVRTKAVGLPESRWWRVPARVFFVVLITVHLVLAPLVRPIVVLGLNRNDTFHHRIADSIPSDPAIANQQVLIVNAPTFLIVSLALLIKYRDGDPLPANALVLGSGVHPTEIRRVDERTLIVRPAGGFLAAPGAGFGSSPPPLIAPLYAFQRADRMLWSEEHPFRLGQQVALSHINVTVTALTEDGRPAEATFRFDKPLEDPLYRWMQFQTGTFIPFTLPAVNETVKLAPARFVPVASE
jgi:hypothetical protein